MKCCGCPKVQWRYVFMFLFGWLFIFFSGNLEILVFSLHVILGILFGFYIIPAWIDDDLTENDSAHN